MEMLAKVGCLALLCVLFVAPHAEALSCQQVSENLAPCVDYLTRGGAVPANCCSGVKTLAGSATTTPDRQTACHCLKSLMGTVAGINAEFAAGLPGQCGVSIPYKISLTTDCSTVQ